MTEVQLASQRSKTCMGFVPVLESWLQSPSGGEFAHAYQFLDGISEVLRVKNDEAWI